MWTSLWDKQEESKLVKWREFILLIPRPEGDAEDDIGTVTGSWAIS